MRETQEINLPIRFFRAKLEERDIIALEQIQKAAINDISQTSYIKETIGRFFNINPDYIEYNFIKSFCDGEHKPSQEQIHLTFHNINNEKHNDIVSTLHNHNIHAHDTNRTKLYSTGSILIIGTHDTYTFFSMVNQTTELTQSAVLTPSR